MVKKILISTLVGTLIYLMVGWLIFDFILGNYTELNTTQIAGFKKSEVEYSYCWLVISCLAYSLLLSILIIRFLNIKEPKKGLFVGIIIGVLIAIMTDSYWNASTYFYSNLIVVLFDIVGAAISVGILGLTVSLVNKNIN
jgi:hypothetical protein